jgi:hypothetical protein
MNEGMTWLQSQLNWERQLDRLRRAEQVRMTKAAKSTTTLAMAKSAPAPETAQKQADRGAAA